MQVWGQLGLHKNTLSQTTKKYKRKKGGKKREKEEQRERGRGREQKTVTGRNIPQYRYLKMDFYLEDKR
jgi:hypothetical protein